LEYWDTATFADNAEAIATTTAADGSIWLSESRLCGSEHNAKWTRMKFVYRAAWAGDHQFSVFGSTSAALKTSLAVSQRVLAQCCVSSRDVSTLR